MATGTRLPRWSALVIALLCLLPLALSNKSCDSEVYRCKRGDEVFKYQKASYCKKSHHGGRYQLDCHGVKHDCICLNVDSICEQIGQYASRFPGWDGGNGGGQTGSPSNSSGSSASASPDPAPMHMGQEEPACPASYPGDGATCRAHEQCKPTPGGVALCCQYTCYHVHQLPCVRDFFAPEDRLCSDKQWERQWDDYPKTI